MGPNQGNEIVPTIDYQAYDDFVLTLDDNVEYETFLV